MRMGTVPIQRTESSGGRSHEEWQVKTSVWAQGPRLWCLGIQSRLEEASGEGDIPSAGNFHQVLLSGLACKSRGLDWTPATNLQPLLPRKQRQRCLEKERESSLCTFPKASLTMS